jgi:hypothetical protein
MATTNRPRLKPASPQIPLAYPPMQPVHLPVRIDVERRPILTASPDGRIILHQGYKSFQNPKHPNDS